MPEATYKEFLLYEEMKDKQDYIKKFSDSRHILGKVKKLTTEDKEHIAAGIALFQDLRKECNVFNICDAFNLSFKWIYERDGPNCDLVNCDETQHTEGMIELFKYLLKKTKLEINQ